MKESLAKITNVVTWYKDEENPSPANLLAALRVLTSHLFLLENNRAEYQQKFERIIYESEESVARATNKANVDVPELYMLRRIMDAAYRVSDAMRSHLSFMKSEMNHLQSQQ